MRSLEGKIGEPRAKYVHSTDKGLFDLPTVLNNVETWAGIGAIIDQGGEWFAVDGHRAAPRAPRPSRWSARSRTPASSRCRWAPPCARSSSTSAAASSADRPFKAVQTGGPSGGCVPESLLDLPVDFERLTEAGSMMGSGGMIVMDDRTCMVDVARYFLDFLAEESCGKCVPCREGLKQMLHDLRPIWWTGAGRPATSTRSSGWPRGMQLGSLCELGKSAPNPVLSTLRYFRDEYEAHIRDRACPAGICRELTAYEIVAGGCATAATPASRPARSTPSPATTKELHVIHHDACISCGACFDVCPTEAIRTFPKVELEGGGGVMPTLTVNGTKVTVADDAVHPRRGPRRRRRRPDAVPVRRPRAVGRLPAVRGGHVAAGLGRGLVQDGHRLQPPGRGRDEGLHRTPSGWSRPAGWSSTCCWRAAPRPR